MSTRDLGDASGSVLSSRSLICINQTKDDGRDSIRPMFGRIRLPPYRPFTFQKKRPEFQQPLKVGGTRQQQKRNTRILFKKPPTKRASTGKRLNNAAPMFGTYFDGQIWQLKKIEKSTSRATEKVSVHLFFHKNRVNYI